MLRLRSSAAPLLALVFATPLFARGQFWSFLGYAQIDSSRDHSSIQLARHDGCFRSIQLRVSGEAIFLDRIVIHFANGTSHEFIANGQVVPQGSNYVIELPGQSRALESVELWYFKAPWEHNPKVILYGVPLPDPEGDSIALDH